MDNDEPEPSSFLGRLFQSVKRMFGAGPASRRQLVDVLTEAKQNGLLDSDALDTMQRLLQVHELQVRDVMIPRSRMVVVERDAAPEDFLPILIESAHSRFPVIDGDRDKVVGILLAKDVLRYFDESHRGSFNMREMLRPAIFIPESKRLNVLLREFRASRNHMAVVVDEYGGVSGLITIEDVLEQIVGEIEDEHDFDEEADMIMERGDGTYIVKALLPLEDFNDHFETNYDTNENKTVGGLVIKGFAYVPKRGEHIVLASMQFDVLNADSRRIHLLKVRRVADQITQTESAAG